MTIRHYAYAAGIATSLVLFAACGDDVTEVTKVSENASLDQVKKFKELPKCEEDIEGTLVYVKDSAKVFGCTSDGWVRFNGLDGADGKNGKNGTSGDDGKSCTAKQNKKKTGYDIVCDGKTVATIENGSDGKKGSDGDDGVSCTAKQNKKKTGIDVTCGDKTVTIPTGIDGDDGVGCSFEEGENGAVKVTCGDDANSLTLFKAACGNASYDPETQFCVEFNGEFVVGKRCKYRASVDVRSQALGDEPEEVDYYNEVYNPTQSFCDGNDTLRSKCYVNEQNEAGEDQMVLVDYDYENEYCDNGKAVRPLARCVKGDKKSPKYKPEYEYCYTTKFAKGIQVDTMPQCGSDDRYFNPRVYYCTLTPAGKGYLNETKVCTASGKTKDSLNIDIRYTGADDFEGRGSICDTRDYQVYKYTTITSGGEDYVWMAQNLNYRDTLLRPTPKGEMHLDSSSFCYGDGMKDENGDEIYPDGGAANCDKYGRLYTWSAAIDSTKLNSGVNAVACGYGAKDCELQGVVRGVCPDGWHLPSQAEIQSLNWTHQQLKVNDQYSYSQGTPAEDLEWEFVGMNYLGLDALGFAALPAGQGNFSLIDEDGDGVPTNTWGFTALRRGLGLWSVQSNADGDAYVLLVYSETKSFMYLTKNHALSVRCVRDAK